jgi:CHASE2 domain-containing sensor protein
LNSRRLLIVGIVWFLAAAAFAIYVAQTSFAIGFIVRGPVSNAVSIARICLLFICTAVLLIGWMIPVGIGVYRLLRL